MYGSVFVTKKIGRKWAQMAEVNIYLFYITHFVVFFLLILIIYFYHFCLSFLFLFVKMNQTHLFSSTTRVPVLLMNHHHTYLGHNKEDNYNTDLSYLHTFHSSNRNAVTASQENWNCNNGKLNTENAQKKSAILFLHESSNGEKNNAFTRTSELKLIKVSLPTW